MRNGAGEKFGKKLPDTNGRKRIQG
jgi:hypothetical protein